VDQVRFQEAERAYADGDWRAAAKAFLASATGGVEGNGPAYHLAGNSLVRLRRHNDAITVYRHALEDPRYAKRPSVWLNLGAAYSAAGSYPEAVDTYASAIGEPGQTAAYKAHQGMAGALYEMGRVADAAREYRAAAVDEGNPDPGKALNNLGLCLMALGRPEDAVEAYRTASGMAEYAGKGRSLANLGLAYTTLGRHEEAVKSFKKASELHSHRLSVPALAAYEASAAAISAPSPQTVDGWTTGELPTAPESAPVAGSVQASGVPIAGAAADSRFFTATEDEMRERDRTARREEREEYRAERNPWVVAAVWIVGVLLVVGAVLGAWALGLGWPTQNATVKGLLDAHQNGKEVARYWVAVPDVDVSKEMANLPPTYRSFTVDSIERSALSSKASVTVTLEKGAPLHYEVTLGREGVGWKVTGISNDWRSTGGGS